MSSPPAGPARKSRRGPAPLPPAERRTHSISVRVNAAELALVDERRGRMQRGEWMRVVSLDQVPRNARPTVPAINAAAWGELARLAANLNQVQKTINEGRAATYPPGLVEDLATQVAEVRRLLVGVTA